MWCLSYLGPIILVFSFFPNIGVSFPLEAVGEAGLGTVRVALATARLVVSGSRRARSLGVTENVVAGVGVPLWLWVVVVVVVVAIAVVPLRCVIVVVVLVLVVVHVFVVICATAQLEQRVKAS